MPRHPEIADVIRSFGVEVVEVDGWRTRGSEDFHPRGSVNHHTAGSANGVAPSLEVLINGRDGIPGPLVQGLQSRELSGQDKYYLIACGRANHAGLGGWRGLSGNADVWGLEIEHTGAVPLPIERQITSARIHAAYLSLTPTKDPGLRCDHREWAPQRKIDAATNVDSNQNRQWVAQFLADPNPAPPQTEDEMWAEAHELAKDEVVRIPIPYGAKNLVWRLYSDTGSEGSVVEGFRFNDGGYTTLFSKDVDIFIPSLADIKNTMTPDTTAIRVKNKGPQAVTIVVSGN